MPNSSSPQAESFSNLNDEEFTFAKLMSLAAGLNMDADLFLTDKILEFAIRIDLTPIQWDKLFGRISNRIGVSKRALNDQKVFVAEKLGIRPTDDPLLLAQVALKQHFENGHHLRATGNGGFWQYTGTHWQSTSDLAIRKKLLPIISEIPIRGDRSAETRCRAALEILRTMVLDDNGWLDPKAPPPNVISVKNGELHFVSNGTVKLKSHQPSTGTLFSLDVDYDPQAISPLFDQTLSEIVSGSVDQKGMHRHLLEFMGHAISGRRDFAAFFILFGSGANGKTTILKLLAALVGNDAVLSQSLRKFTCDRFHLAPLAGKTILLDDDFAVGSKLPAEPLKLLAESKMLSARHPYGRTFTFRSCVLPVLATNSLPLNTDLTVGLRRRAHLIPFKRTFSQSEQDVSRVDKILSSETSGMLNHCLTGYQRLRKRKKFRPAKDCLEAKKTWINTSNPTAIFIEECCEIVPGARTRLSHLYGVMDAWRKATGVTGTPSMYRLRSELEALGYKSVRPQNVQHICDLVLKQASAN